ncbi:MAG: hypothetical protein JW715_10545 [Sedimentisphaerales bacterium]|nr:hypothetical protein [Sedimentisphaerales bacterium]
MENKETEKAPIVVSKSFITFGPTLHYSHKNVQICWFLAIVTFGISCLFWSKIATGYFWSFEIEAVSTPEFWRLDKSLITVVSIFEYPWQILVLGLLMGILAITPVLISQLMSFEYSLPFILEVVFFANLPGFALCLLISCLAVACRPLRFRSRFIAVALCTAPQLAYWGYFGGARGVEPIEWGFSFAPWICAWLESLIIAGFVLGIGHFTRYKPGLVWIFTTITLLIAMVVFEMAIGFDELDYQLYIAKNNPEHVSEFHDHSLTEALDRTTRDPAVQKYLQSFFYPTEQEALRAELKREIQIQLSYDRWPVWFIVPKELKYQAKKQWLHEQYDSFISSRQKNRQKSRRMPIVLYFKGILGELSPDVRILGDEEILHFYSDYTHDRSTDVWLRLYNDFPSSPESLEARWRIARIRAGRSIFKSADELLVETQTMLDERIKTLKVNQTSSESLFGLFRRPADTIMTLPRLNELQRRLEQLRALISPENRTGEPESKSLLAQFIMLNPHSLNYHQQLDRLLQQTKDSSPLRDNILLAQAKLINNEQIRADRLNDLQKQYKDTDGGIQALYELGLLKIGFWRQQDESDLQLKIKLLNEARAVLTNFLSLYPDSFYAEQVKKNLEGLPSN